MYGEGANRKKRITSGSCRVIESHVPIHPAENARVVAPVPHILLVGGNRTCMKTIVLISRRLRLFLSQKEPKIRNIDRYRPHTSISGGTGFSNLSSFKTKQALRTRCHSCHQTIPCNSPALSARRPLTPITSKMYGCFLHDVSTFARAVSPYSSAVPIH